MPSFASALETTLHKALEAASSRRHEYATLEHLLLALIDDEHGSKVMAACGVDTEELKTIVAHYLDTELAALKVDAATDPSPTSGFQRGGKGWHYKSTPCGPRAYRRPFPVMSEAGPPASST